MMHIYTRCKVQWWPAMLMIISGVNMVSSNPAGYEDFSGQQVLRIVPQRRGHVQLLSKLEEEVSQLDFWKQPYYVKHDVDVRVPGNMLHWVKQLLDTKNITYTVLIDDVQRAVDVELQGLTESRRRRQASNQSFADDFEFFTDNVLNSFSSHDEINAWLERVSMLCGSRCSTHNIGMTGERRKLRVIKISGSRRRSSTNKAIWIDGGIHAREWISPAVANNIIYKPFPYCMSRGRGRGNHWSIDLDHRHIPVNMQAELVNSSLCVKTVLLITEYHSERCVKHLVENFDWYILPVANPDGYEYSRIRNRMWRKNRKQSTISRRPWWTIYYYGANNYQHCYGVDLNRNFGFKWGETGTSSNPCSDIYGGSEAFSEPETQAIRNFTTTIHNNSELTVYLSLHAYGQYWLYSWGYTRQLPYDYQSLNKIASRGANAIYWASNRKTFYTVGAAARTLYASSGASDDWAKGSLGARYAFTLELPPSDENTQGNGFLIPPSAIISVVEDTWPGIRTMAATVLKFGNRTSASHSRHDFCTLGA